MPLNFQGLNIFIFRNLPIRRSATWSRHPVDPS